MPTSVASPSPSGSIERPPREAPPEGRRTVDEHAIFTAVAEQRRLLLEAQERSKSARGPLL